MTENSKNNEKAKKTKKQRKRRRFTKKTKSKKTKSRCSTFAFTGDAPLVDQGLSANRQKHEDTFVFSSFCICQNIFFY